MATPALSARKPEAARCVAAAGERMARRTSPLETNAIPLPPFSCPMTRRDFLATSAAALAAPLAGVTAEAKPVFQQRGYYLCFMRMPTFGLPVWREILDAEKRALLREQLVRVQAIVDRHRDATGGGKELHRIAQWIVAQWTSEFTPFLTSS